MPVRGRYPRPAHRQADKRVASLESSVNRAHPFTRAACALATPSEAAAVCALARRRAITAEHLSHALAVAPRSPWTTDAARRSMRRA
jgi:hypothetical protein